MRVYITGATGFVGSYVMREALSRGHSVTAVVRPTSSFTPPESGDVEVASVDLRSPDGLADSLKGADVVIHLAAAKEGDFYEQFAGTVVATENLLSAMAGAGVENLVGISTFSVYDYLNTKPNTLIDEDSPIDTSPQLRDEYAQTKLIQESLYRDFGAEPSNAHVVLRPGMIYGKDNLWHALLGAEMGPRFLKIGSRATLPMVYVENCAEAILLAAEKLIEQTSSLDGEVINIVDDDLPTQAEYAELVSTRMETPPTISIPWPAIRAAAGLLKKGNELALGGRAKFPGIAVPDRLHARFKPLRYTNVKAKRQLDWKPRFNLTESIDRSIAAQNGHEERV